MLVLKYLLMILGAGLFGSAGALVAYDIFLSAQLRKLLRRNTTDESGAEVGALAILITESIVVVPDGVASVRGSQIWGAQPGTLCPGIHIVTPLLDSVAIFDTREQVYSIRSVSPEIQSHAHPEDHRRTALGQAANHDGTDGRALRKEFARPEACAIGFR